MKACLILKQHEKQLAFLLLTGLVLPQDLVEKVVVLRQAVEQTQRSGPAAIGVLLAEKMSLYANLLAAQGSLATAITYLPDDTNQVRVVFLPS